MRAKDQEESEQYSNKMTYVRLACLQLGSALQWVVGNAFN